MRDDTIDTLVERVRTWTAAGCSLERIVKHLQEAGSSKGDAALALSRGAGVPRAAAIRIVHHSEAYAFRKAVDEAWNAALWDCLELDDLLAPGGDESA